MYLTLVSGYKDTNDSPTLVMKDHFLDLFFLIELRYLTALVIFTEHQGRLDGANYQNHVGLTRQKRAPGCVQYNHRGMSLRQDHPGASLRRLLTLCLPLQS